MFNLKQGVSNFKTLLKNVENPPDESKNPKEKKNSDRIGWILLVLSVMSFMLHKILGVVFLILTYFYIKSKTHTPNAGVILNDTDVYTSLPLELESLIMTIESGNDIIQGLKKVSELQYNESPIKAIFRDLLDRFSGGLSFSDAVESVKQKYQNQTVSQVLNYLKISVKEGGEIRDQLRELADTIFQQYEFFIDKEVNKMPAKALLPVMIILVGMLLNFLAQPITILSKEFTKVFQSFGTSLGDL